MYLAYQPGQCLLRDIWRHRMRAVELTILHLIARTLQLRHDPTTALVDRQDLIPRPMRDEHPGLRVRIDREDEPWRKRDHALEQITVREADADCVRRTVREPFDR